MPGAQKRLGELDALMAGEGFWNNREQAQKLIEEANVLRKRVDPLIHFEKQIEDSRVMIELGESEPQSAQAKLQQEIEADVAKLIKALEAHELEVFLHGQIGRAHV